MPANPLHPVLRTIRKRFGIEGKLPDAHLLERFAANDEAAFAALVERHGPMVWGTCLRVAGDAHAAEDAFQATWLVLSQKAPSLRDADSLPAWPHRVAFRLALSARGKRSSAPLPDVPAPSAGPEEDAAVRETCAVVDEEVGRLPPKYRLPVLLCFFEGRTHAEAAAELGWPVGTVAGRLARAKDLLQARLARRGLAPSTWPLPLAGALPPITSKAGTGATALATAFLASGVGGRLLAVSAVLLIPALAVLAFFASPPAPRSKPTREATLPPTKNAPRERMLHGDYVRCVSWSPGGTTLASASADKTVKLWDSKTGKVIAILEGHTDAVWSVAHSHDGKTLASGAYDKSVRLWDARTGKAVAILKGHTDAVWSVAFNPDGRTLASGSSDNSVRVWDVKTRKELAILKGHTAQVTSVAYDRGGKILASGSHDRKVKLWDVKTGKVLATLEGHTATVRSVAFSPNGKTLASASWDRTIKMWDVPSGKTLATWAGHENGVDCVAFSPDGTELVSASRARREGPPAQVKRWDVKTGKALAGFDWRGGTVNHLAYSPDGKSVVSAGEDRTVGVWDAATGEDLVAREGRK